MKTIFAKLGALGGYPALLFLANRIRPVPGLVAIVTLSFASLGCASAYKGPRPNFDLNGPAARAEADKFYLDESNHFEWRGAWFEMGLNKDWYTISSLRPMIEEISPEAGMTLHRARRWNIARYSAYAAAAVLAGLAIANDHTPTHDKLVVASVLTAGTGIAMGFTYDSLLSSGAYQFNRDLKLRFTPALAWVWRY